MQKQEWCAIATNEPERLQGYKHNNKGRDFDYQVDQQHAPGAERKQKRMAKTTSSSEY